MVRGGAAGLDSGAVMVEARAQWKSKMGFILAASGSAIGLGNIVVFSGNAYKYGGGAFYVPYLVGLEFYFRTRKITPAMPG